MTTACFSSYHEHLPNETRRGLDLGHPGIEARFAVVGQSALGRILIVIGSARGNTLRVISARRATKRERHDYET